MAKRRKGKLVATAVPTRRLPGIAEQPVPRPAFWFGFELPWLQLIVVRVVLFGLLATDALLQISHAPRYGAGGFNVANLPFLDALAPGRTGFAIGELVISFVLVLAAFGVATRIVLPVATVIYGWLYFGSQLDSYQHHYLVWLVLLLACFVPWQRPVGTPLVAPMRSWALRLVLVQLGIVYLWAAVSKMSTAWTDGSSLGLQLRGSLRSVIDASIGIKLASRFVLLAELALAFTVWLRPAWWIALPLGIGLHAGIIATDLDIGLFSQLMLGFYLLVVPPRAFRWLAERIDRIPPASVARLTSSSGSGLAVGVLLVGGVGLAALVRFHYALGVAVTLTVLAAIGCVLLDRGIALAACAAFALWLVVDHASSQAVDYYRFWGGSTRRLGDREASMAAYRKLTQIAPEEPAGHYQLGKLLLAAGDEAGGLAELHLAQQLEPSRARSFDAEADYLASKGRTEEAAAKRKQAGTSTSKDEP